jgi:hypothetical protein
MTKEEAENEAIKANNYIKIHGHIGMALIQENYE